jgi:hypothetical protein
LHAGILAFEPFIPLMARMDNAAQLHLPEQLIRRCAQLI